ncbi:FAD-dependent oxidoreductase [Pseudonocardia sp. NPDC046786]|uniref:NAD(P)/FAD-dependent oxidoreductase n=1 Tax=Pseudonocardia sp. NPDC046786 TaxID=3155471 RepID=UPI0033D3C157
MSDGTLVVGAGQAGAQLVASLRDAGETAPIVLIGAEPDPPYQRPPLSKGYLAGDVDADRLMLRAPAFYRDRDVELVVDERITGLGRTTATTGRGRELTFDRLALTVGARPRRLDVPGSDLEGVHVLRDRADADGLRDALGRARRVVVIGGGFVGLEAAAGAGGLDRSVTVVECAERLMGRAVAPMISRFYRDAHERRGARVLLGAGVVALDGEHGRVRVVHLADGTDIAADLVLVGIGAAPRTELAEQLGISCRGGVPVDRDARTAIDGVVAAGDCTMQPHPTVPAAAPRRVESVQNAVYQAKVAAAALTGGPRPAPEVPWFWSDQADLKLQIAGLSVEPDEIVVRGDPGTERFAALHYRDGALLAVDAVNSPADYLVVRRALAGGINLPADVVRRSDRPLKELLTA